MSHDRGCPCGREKWEYEDCRDLTCTKKGQGMAKTSFGGIHSTVAETIQKRASVYGDFMDNAECAQAIKDAMRAHAGWATLPPTMKEGLDLIALKMARIVTGDWRHKDNPHDIAGYANRMEEFIDGA